MKLHGEHTVVLTTAPLVDNERGLINSILQEKNDSLFRNRSINDLKNRLLLRISKCKLLIIDDSQKLLLSRKLLMNHFLLMSHLLNTNLKVMYLRYGTYLRSNRFYYSPQYKGYKLSTKLEYCTYFNVNIENM